MSKAAAFWMGIGTAVVTTGLALPVLGMERLNDGEMSEISGQAGVTMEMNSRTTIDRFSYFTNDRGIYLEDIKVGSASSAGGQAYRAYDLDIVDDGNLSIGYNIQDERIEVGGVTFDDSNGASMGSFWVDRDMTGNFTIKPGTSTSAEGFTFDSVFNLTNGRFGYQTNGNQVFLDDVSLNINSQGQTLDVIDGVVRYVTPVTGDLQIGAIRYAKQADHYRGDASGLDSYGSIAMDFDYDSTLELQGAGGRFGSQGLRVDGETTLNSANFLYSTNGYGIALNNMSGQSQVSDLRIEVAPDFTSESRNGLAFTLMGSEASASGNLSIGSIELGGSGSIGSVNLEWLYEDAQFGGETYSNQYFIMAGGHPDAGPEGMRIASEWSLADAQIGYTANGNQVIFDGIQSWGRGDVTVNVTGDGSSNGTEFFDGLRVGFDDVSGGYRMDGVRVGGESSDVQGGVEMLSALGIYRNFEFGSLDGHYTLGAGGANGEGITINSDIVIQDGRIGALTEQSGQGVWADDLEFESHIRDMTVDVTEEGLSMIQGEAWSTMDIGNLRVGDADSGASFGRIVWQRYGQNNEMVISAPDDGSEGLKIALTHVFSEASGDRQNRLMWEPDSGSGVQLVLNNIHTSDVTSSSNTYGVKTDLNIAVRESSGSGELGFSVNTRTRFRELNIDSVDLVHPDGNATMLHGVSIQNMDMESNLTATPIQ